MRFLVVALVLLANASCAQAPKPIPTPASQIYTSTPSWTGSPEAKIPTKLGELRLFNANCGYEVDVALIGEIFDRHVSALKLEKSLELRVFPHRYVLPLKTFPGFELTNEQSPDTDTGTTSSSPESEIVVSVQPVGWAHGGGLYESPCGAETISASAEALITMSSVHELIGHGVKRAALIPRSPNEECDAQALERLVFKELDGRVAFRKKQ